MKFIRIRPLIQRPLKTMERVRARNPVLTAEHKKTSRTIRNRSAIRKRAKCAERLVPGDLTRTAFGSFPAYKPGKNKN